MATSTKRLLKSLDDTSSHINKKTKFKFNDIHTLERVYKNLRFDKKAFDNESYNILNTADNGVEILALYKTYEYFTSKVLYHKYPDGWTSPKDYKGFLLFLLREFNLYWKKAGSTPI